MAWIRIDDRMPQHPKIVGLSSDAFRTYIASLCYAGAHETDGRIPAGALPLLWGSAKTAAELERAGLWEKGDDGWVIHDYLDYQLSRAEIEETRRKRSDAASAAAAARWAPDASVHASNKKGRGDAQPVRRRRDSASEPHAAADASRMPNACEDDASTHASTHEQRIADASTRTCVEDATSHIHPIPRDDDSSLRSSSSSPARGARAAADDDLDPLASDPDPPAVREIRDLVLMALPRKYAADPLTFDEAAQLGRDYAGAHEAVGQAIAEARRRNKLPFPRTIRGILQEVHDAATRDTAEQPWGAGDPILEQLRRVGALIE